MFLVVNQPCPDVIQPNVYVSISRCILRGEKKLEDDGRGMMEEEEMKPISAQRKKLEV